MSQVCLLHLDDALIRQPSFLSACEKQGAAHLRMQEEGAAVRLWAKTPAYEALRKKITAFFGTCRKESKICFMGSGDFHHVTGALLSATLEGHPEPVTVIHFDNHPDWVNFKGGVHCGSWINYALAHPAVKKMITLGVCSKDLIRPEWKGANLKPLAQGVHEVFPYAHAPSQVKGNYGAGGGFRQVGNALHWKTIANMGEDAFLENLLKRIETTNVYITIDKDVLRHEYAYTNWDQGMMSLPFVLKAIERIGVSHTVIGADVIGDYSAPRYTGTPWARLLKHGEILIDQSTRKPDVTEISKLNASVNETLMHALTKAMAQ